MRVDMKEVLALLDTVKDGAEVAKRLKKLDDKAKEVADKLRIADSVEKVEALEAAVNQKAKDLEARARALESAAKAKEQELKNAYQARVAELDQKISIERARYNEGRDSMAKAQKLMAEAEETMKAVVAKEADLVAREFALEKAKKQVTSKVYRIYQIMGEE